MPNGKIKELEYLNRSQMLFLGKIKPIESYGINYNGYGYSDQIIKISLTRQDVLQLNKLKTKEQKPYKSEDEIAEEWCRRLSKLTQVPIEVARDVAQEKIEFKENQIEKLRERQYHRESQKREVLIRAIQRSNPLRRIQNTEHAHNILAASNRHNNTDYDNLLERARELARIGEMSRDEVKEFAVNHMK